jgi:hypothetical protein
MGAAFGTRDTGIDIRRLTLGLRLCGDPQRLDPVAKRLDGLARGRLGQALARVRLEGPEPAAGDGTRELVFIERLAVDCGGNTAWDDDALASHMARRLALALEARLAEPDVLRFRDRPDYVAAAALAIAQGRLGQCWWFDELDGLQPLAASIALRALVINEAAHGTAALARLAESSLRQVIGTLTEGDASRLLAWLAGFDATVAPPFRSLWPSAVQLQRQGDAPARWLAALVAAERAAPGSMGARSLRLLRSMVTLLQRAAAGDRPVLQGPRDPAMVQAMRTGHFEDSAWLQGLSDGEFDTVLATLQEMEPPAQPARRQRLVTPHGGFFLLLARAHRLGWLAHFQSTLQRRCPEWPEGRRDALCRAIACRIAAAALDPAPHRSPLGDPAVTTVCRLEGTEIDEYTDLVVAALRAVLRDVDPAARAPRPASAHASTRSHRWQHLLAEAAAVVMADLARALPGLAASTPAFLRAQALALPAVVEVPAAPEDGDASPNVVRLGRAPLDVLLVLSGVKRQRLLLPGVPPIELQEDHGA